MNKKPELLAPAGNMEKLKTAFHFGADAVYIAGKNYGLRAFSDNFTDDELFEAVNFAHDIGKKVYVAVNIFAQNKDFDELESYLAFLKRIGTDAVIVSDAGVFSFAVKAGLPVHISTQANTLNKYAAAFWGNLGASRVVLAREAALNSVKEISEYCRNVEIECFVHGAMCISYSGRCLLSDYLTSRSGNRGECVQACRWKWEVKEVSRNDALPVEEDKRGTYIFNSRDLNMLRHLWLLAEAGVNSFKIEGRMKSVFYVATTVNAYRRALDGFSEYGKDFDAEPLYAELGKASHRQYTTGFYFGDDTKQYYESSRAEETRKFTAVVKSVKNNGEYEIEQRNRFAVGDELEILSPKNSFGKTFCVSEIRDADGNSVSVCDKVQQRLFITCPYILTEGDVLSAEIKGLK